MLQNRRNRQVLETKRELSDKVLVISLFSGSKRYTVGKASDFSLVEKLIEERNIRFWFCTKQISNWNKSLGINTKHYESIFIGSFHTSGLAPDKPNTYRSDSP